MIPRIKDTNVKISNIEYKTTIKKWHIYMSFSNNYYGVVVVNFGVLATACIVAEIVTFCKLSWFLLVSLM